MDNLEQSQFEQARKEQEMKRLLEEQRRAELRQLEEREAAEETGTTQSEQEEETKISRSPRAIMTRLRAARQAEAAGAEGEEGGGEEGALARAQRLEAGIKRLKNIYRIINGASAATLVGLIVTFLVMNAQLIFGNLLKVKFVPPLSLPEIIIILVVDFLVAVAIFIIFSIIAVLIWLIKNSDEAIKLIGKELFNRICQAFGGCQE